MKYGIIFTVSHCNVHILVWILIYFNYLGLVLCFHGFNGYSQLLHTMIFLLPDPLFWLVY